MDSARVQLFPYPENPNPWNRQARPARRKRICSTRINHETKNYNPTRIDRYSWRDALRRIRTGDEGSSSGNRRPASRPRSLGQGHEQNGEGERQG